MTDVENRQRWAWRIRAFDPRVTIVLALLVGLLTWQAPVSVLAFYALALLVLLVILNASTSVDATVLRSFVLFVAFWAALKLGSDLLRGEPWATAWVDTAVLGLRLFVLVCLGLTLTLAASPRRLGLALAWYSRPVLRQRAWKAALALSLMVHFLPMALRVAATAGETIRRRCPQLSWGRRALLLPQTTIRALSQKTWDQTLAIAARRLDAPAAWTASFKWRAWDVGVGLLIGGAVVGTALL